MEDRPPLIASSTSCGPTSISRRGGLACASACIGCAGPSVRTDHEVFAPGIDVDVVRFEQLAGGGEGERRAALALYGADLGSVQLAYDDAVMPLRRRLAATWRSLAAEALGSPDLPQHLIRRIAEVGASGASLDPELAHLVDAAVQRVGRPLGPEPSSSS